jgi:hypothetical protein
MSRSDATQAFSCELNERILCDLEPVKTLCLFLTPLFGLAGRECWVIQIWDKIPRSKLII